LLFNLFFLLLNRSRANINTLLFFLLFCFIIFIDFIFNLVNLEIKYLYKEIEALKRLDHKNIIKLYSFCTDINENIVLILEYAEGGSLRGN